MKKQAILIAMLIAIISGTSMGQTALPNAGMENWHAVGSYENPDGWQSSNEGTILVGVVGVKKDTSALDGIYAARLESKLLPFVNVVAPGAISTGILDIANTTFVKGIPLIDPNPVGVIGYYKLFPQGNDSCYIYSALFRWDTVNNKRDTTAVAIFRGGAASNYTFFSAPFVTVLPLVTPDSEIVTIVNVIDYATAHAGTVMYVDDVDFTNSINVPTLPDVLLKFYPNPADEMLVLTIPPEIDAQNILVSNVAGTMVKEILAPSSLTSAINTSKYAEGVYVLFVKNKEGKVVASGKFTVKH